jgi:protein gp37
MGRNTKVEYVDDSFSPWHGCSRISAGCRFCFAADLERRWGNDDLWRRQGPRRIVSEQQWNEPRKWNLAARAEGRRRRILNGTMCDVFEDHPAVTGARARLFNLIEATPWLLWFPLTFSEHLGRVECRDLRLSVPDMSVTMGSGSVPSRVVAGV